MIGAHPSTAVVQHFSKISRNPSPFQVNGFAPTPSPQPSFWRPSASPSSHPPTNQIVDIRRDRQIWVLWAWMGLGSRKPCFLWVWASPALFAPDRPNLNVTPNALDHGASGNGVPNTWCIRPCVWVDVPEAMVSPTVYF